MRHRALSLPKARGGCQKFAPPAPPHGPPPTGLGPPRNNKGASATGPFAAQIGSLFLRLCTRRRAMRRSQNAHPTCNGIYLVRNTPLESKRKTRPSTDLKLSHSHRYHAKSISLGGLTHVTPAGSAASRKRDIAALASTTNDLPADNPPRKHVASAPDAALLQPVITGARPASIRPGSRVRAAIPGRLFRIHALGGLSERLDSDRPSTSWMQRRGDWWANSCSIQITFT